MHPLTTIVIASTVVMTVLSALAEYQRLKLMKRANKELNRRGYD